MARHPPQPKKEPIPGVSVHVEREVAMLASDLLHRRALLEEQLEFFVESLLIEGSTTHQIARLARADEQNRWPDCTLERVRRHQETIWTRWREERAEDADLKRTAAIERLHQYRREARARRPQPNWKVVLECERLLAKLEGTEAVKKHAHEVSGQIQQNHLLAAVVANYDPEERERMLAEQREMEQLAEAARNLLPALGKTGSDGE